MHVYASGLVFVSADMHPRLGFFQKQRRLSRTVESHRNVGNNGHSPVYNTRRNHGTGYTQGVNCRVRFCLILMNIFYNVHVFFKWLDSQFCIENLIWLTCGTYKSPNDKNNPKVVDNESSSQEQAPVVKDEDLEYRLLMGKSTNAAQLLCNIILNGRDTTADRS